MFLIFFVHWIFIVNPSFFHLEYNTRDSCRLHVLACMQSEPETYGIRRKMILQQNLSIFDVIKKSKMF